MWTAEQKLDYLMTRPWAVSVSRDDDEGYLIARVAEIPDAIATGETESLLAKDLYDSLRSSLAARLEFDDPIPLPHGEKAPWELGAPPAPGKPALARLAVQKTDVLRDCIEYAA